MDNIYYFIGGEMDGTEIPIPEKHSGYYRHAVKQELQPFVGDYVNNAPRSIKIQNYRGTKLSFRDRTFYFMLLEGLDLREAIEILWQTYKRAAQAAQGIMSIIDFS